MFGEGCEQRSISHLTHSNLSAECWGSVSIVCGLCVCVGSHLGGCSRVVTIASTFVFLQLCLGTWVTTLMTVAATTTAVIFPFLAHLICIQGKHGLILSPHHPYLQSDGKVM